MRLIKKKLKLSTSETEKLKSIAYNLFHLNKTYSKSDPES